MCRWRIQEGDSPHAALGSSAYSGVVAASSSTNPVVVDTDGDGAADIYVLGDGKTVLMKDKAATCRSGLTRGRGSVPPMRKATV